jgi:hypothetical protein
MIVVLLADTRTGSTAFGNALISNGRFQYIGEVLHPQSPAGVGILYDHIAGCTLSDLLNTTLIQQRLDDAINRLRGESRSAHIMIDIKYHDLGVIPSHPRVLGTVPPLLAYLMSREFWIVHLNRSNRLDAVISQEAAVTNRVHHIYETETAGQSDSSMAEIFLDPYRTVTALLERENSLTTVRSWLQDYSRCVDIDYEAAFLSPNGASLVTTLLSKCLDDPSLEFEPRTVHLKKRFGYKIANEDQMRRLFLGTRWELSFEESASSGVVFD